MLPMDPVYLSGALGPADEMILSRTWNITVAFPDLLNVLDSFRGILYVYSAIIVVISTVILILSIFFIFDQYAEKSIINRCIDNLSKTTLNMTMLLFDNENGNY